MISQESPVRATASPTPASAADTQPVPLCPVPYNLDTATVPQTVYRIGIALEIAFVVSVPGSIPGLWICTQGNVQGHWFFDHI